MGSDAFLMGNGLHSCTSEIQVLQQFLVNGRLVVLINTPWFNDVEQTRGQRQTGCNDLPGKGERVASGW